MTLFAEYRPRTPRDPRGEPPADLSIRAATLADATSLARIAHERQGGAEEEILARFRREIGHGSATPDRLLWVAEAVGEIVGFARVAFFRPPAEAPAHAAPPGWYLAGVVVPPAHRRRGIGAGLTAVRMAWIAARADAAYYFANARNAATVDLHAAFGFRELTRTFWHPDATFEGGVGILFRAEIVDRSAYGASVSAQH